MNSMTATSVFLSSLCLLACNADINPDSRDEKNIAVAGEVPPIIFHRSSEPNEQAFTFLLPVGWNISGGITGLIQIHPVAPAMR